MPDSRHAKERCANGMVLRQFRMEIHEFARESIDRPALDAETEHAARIFIQRLEGKYAVIEAILFGSRARGDHGPDSDADVAVILEGDRGERYKVAGQMAEIAFDVMLETGILIDPTPLWEGEFQHLERFNNPALIANIKRDGLRL